MVAAVGAVIERARRAGMSNLEALTNRPDVLLALAENGFRSWGAVAFRVKSLTSRPLPSFFKLLAHWRILGCDCDVV